MRENTGGGSPSPPPPTEERAGERRRSLKIPSPWPSPRAPLAGRGNGCLRGRTIFSTKQHSGLRVGGTFLSRVSSARKWQLESRQNPALRDRKACATA